MARDIYRYVTPHYRVVYCLVLVCTSITTLFPKGVSRLELIHPSLSGTLVIWHSRPGKLLLYVWKKAHRTQRGSLFQKPLFHQVVGTKSRRNYPGTPSVPGVYLGWLSPTTRKTVIWWKVLRLWSKTALFSGVVFSNSAEYKTIFWSLFFPNILVTFPSNSQLDRALQIDHWSCIKVTDFNLLLHVRFIFCSYKSVVISHQMLTWHARSYIICGESG